LITQSFTDYTPNSIGPTSTHSPVAETHNRNYSGGEAYVTELRQNLQTCH